jgi:hypothetical protein
MFPALGLATLVRLHSGLQEPSLPAAYLSPQQIPDLGRQRVLPRSSKTLDPVRPVLNLVQALDQAQLCPENRPSQKEDLKGHNRIPRHPPPLLQLNQTKVLRRRLRRNRTASPLALSRETHKAPLNPRQMLDNLAQTLQHKRRHRTAHHPTPLKPQALVNQVRLSQQAQERRPSLGKHLPKSQGPGTHPPPSAPPMPVLPALRTYAQASPRRNRSPIPARDRVLVEVTLVQSVSTDGSAPLRKRRCKRHPVGMGGLAITAQVAGIAPQDRPRHLPHARHESHMPMGRRR